MEHCLSERHVTFKGQTLLKNLRDEEIYLCIVKKYSNNKFANHQQKKLAESEVKLCKNHL